MARLYLVAVLCSNETLRAMAPAYMYISHVEVICTALTLSVRRPAKYSNYSTVVSKKQHVARRIPLHWARIYHVAHWHSHYPWIYIVPDWHTDRGRYKQTHTHTVYTHRQSVSKPGQAVGVGGGGDGGGGYGWEREREVNNSVNNPYSFPFHIF